MHAAEVHSQVIGCTVRLDDSLIECVVTNFSTGEVPQLFVRYENGSTAWVEAKHWTVVRVAPVAIEEPQRAREEIRAHERNTLPRIPYATSTK
jgi:hypothetical protein